MCELAHAKDYDFMHIKWQGEKNDHRMDWWTVKVRRRDARVHWCQSYYIHRKGKIERKNLSNVYRDFHKPNQIKFVAQTSRDAYPRPDDARSTPIVVCAFSLLHDKIEYQIVLLLDGYYVAYKPITLSCILFMFIEIKFINCHSGVMFSMKSMSMCND